MDCDKNATKLTDCHHHPWGKHNCNVDENIVIKCANRKGIPARVTKNNGF